MEAVPGGTTNREWSFFQPSVFCVERPENSHSVTFSWASRSVTLSRTLPLSSTRVQPERS